MIFVCEEKIARNRAQQYKIVAAQHSVEMHDVHNSTVQSSNKSFECVLRDCFVTLAQQYSFINSY